MLKNSFARVPSEFDQWSLSGSCLHARQDPQGDDSRNCTVDQQRSSAGKEASKRPQYLVLLTLACIVLFFSACGSTESTSDGEAADQEDMNQFAGDQDFQQAHDEPEQIAFSGKGQMVKIATPDGEPANAYVIMAENPGNEYLFVFHEWWGLNEHIKREADRLSGELENVSVFALDLYDGQVAASQEAASRLMQSVSQERAEAIIKGGIGQAGSAASIATIGWCFGGSWSLKASILAGGQGAGCVMYYGMPVQEATKLAPLKADILGIFASKDAFITPQVVENFKELCTASNKELEVHMYDADHAFANPSNPHYDPEAAKEANALALEFLKEKL